jgi:hypothetical protein
MNKKSCLYCDHLIKQGQFYFCKASGSDSLFSFGKFHPNRIDSGCHVQPSFVYQFKPKKQ